MQCKSFYKLKGYSIDAHSPSFTATPWTLSRSQVPQSGPRSPHAAAAVRDGSIAWGSPAPWGCFLSSRAALVAAMTCSLQEKLGCFRKCMWAGYIFFWRNKRIQEVQCKENLCQLSSPVQKHCMRKKVQAIRSGLTQKLVLFIHASNWPVCKWYTWKRPIYSNLMWSKECLSLTQIPLYKVPGKTRREVRSS